VDAIRHGWLGPLEHLEIAQRAGDLRADLDRAQLAFRLYAPLELAAYRSRGSDA
jgi:hypothetical protein